MGFKKQIGEIFRNWSKSYDTGDRRLPLSQNQDSRNINEFAGVKFHQHNLPVVSQQYFTLLANCVHCQMAQFQLNFKEGNIRADIRYEEEQANVQM